MNHNIRKVLDAIALLRDVQGCELEVQALAHKVQAMYSQGKEGLTGVAFIDACTDEELIAAIARHDERIGMGEFIDPHCFNYLRRHRPRCLAEGARIQRS